MFLCEYASFFCFLYILLVSSLKTARPRSALCSRLSCLSGRQELVGSTDNLPTSLRQLLGMRRLFLPLPTVGVCGVLANGSCWGQCPRG